LPYSATMLSTFTKYRWHALAWISYIFTNNVLTAFSVIQEFARNSLVVEPWEVFTWELSSGAMSLFLIPAILVYDKLFPIDFQRPLPALAAHIPATFVYSLVHVGGFVTIRKWVYGWADRIYTFGDLPVELFYEYRKDAVTYFSALLIIYVFRELRRLKQGETKLTRTEQKNSQSLKLIATKGNQKVVISPSDIDSIEAAGNYVQLNVGDLSYLMRATMQSVAEQLKPFNFSRVHRAHIVNEDKIISAKPKRHGGMLLELASGAQLDCSRRYRQNLRSL
jgi:hypothetical protein